MQLLVVMDIAMEMSLPEIQLDSMVLFVMMGGTAVMQQLFAGDTNQIQYSSSNVKIILGNWDLLMDWLSLTLIMELSHLYFLWMMCNVLDLSQAFRTADISFGIIVLEVRELESFAPIQIHHLTHLLLLQERLL